MSTQKGKFKADSKQLNILAASAASVAKRKVCRCLTKDQILDLENGFWKCKKCGTYS